jgi:tetratricopeptide (TPR) repeat protein
LADLDQTLASVPDFAFAYNDRAKVKWALQDFQGALDDFSQTIALNDHFVDAYFNRGMLKNDLGDYQGAIVIWHRIDLNSPQFADAYFIGLGRNAPDSGQKRFLDGDSTLSVVSEAFYM